MRMSIMTMRKQLKSSLVYKPYYSFSTLKLVQQRDEDFLSLLKEKEKELSGNQVANIARVLSKKENIDSDLLKAFDHHVLHVTRNLDRTQLRQVMSFYVLGMHSNEYALYEIKQRYTALNCKNWVKEPSQQNIQEKTFGTLFDWRNCFFQKLSKLSGISFK